MTHLSDADLRRWLALGAAADRERVLGHLADCDSCRRALSAMAQEPADLEPQSVLVQPEAVRDRGYAAYHPSSTTGVWAAWLRPAYALAAVIVLVIAGLIVLRPVASDVDDSVRGSELQISAPVGAVRELREFKWASPIAAPRYRVIIRGPREQEILATLTADERLAVTSDLRARLSGGAEYTWQVEALDETGAVIARSRTATFSISP